MFRLLKSLFKIVFLIKIIDNKKKLNFFLHMQLEIEKAAVKFFFEMQPRIKC